MPPTPEMNTQSPLLNGVPVTLSTHGSACVAPVMATPASST